MMDSLGRRQRKPAWAVSRGMLVTLNVAAALANRIILAVMQTERAVTAFVPGDITAFERSSADVAANSSALRHGSLHSRFQVPLLAPPTAQQIMKQHLRYSLV